MHLHVHVHVHVHSIITRARDYVTFLTDLDARRYGKCSDTGTQRRYRVVMQGSYDHMAAVVEASGGEAGDAHSARRSGARPGRIAASRRLGASWHSAIGTETFRAGAAGTGGGHRVIPVGGSTR